jgi:hypothetical protein
MLPARPKHGYIVSFTPVETIKVNIPHAIEKRYNDRVLLQDVVAPFVLFQVQWHVSFTLPPGQPIW